MAFDRKNGTQTLAFPSSAGSLFEGYFEKNKGLSFRKKDLMDARARRLFENTALACSVDAYPFQVPLEGKSGPQVQADGHAMLMLSSYDYLGLIGDPRVDAALVRLGSDRKSARHAAMRCIAGATDPHVDRAPGARAGARRASKLAAHA